MRIWYHTLGCKANQYDTDRIRREVESRGAVAASDPSVADVAIVNTCTVTNQAEADARRVIRRLRRDAPDLTIVVAGCSTAVRADDYRAMAEVDLVVPGHDAEAVSALLPLAGGSSTAEPKQAGTRAWLKIQDGCDRKCSFCATRIARGASRSRPPEEIVDEALRLSEHHPELVLTGIHIGHYGKDRDDGTSLARLCRALVEAVPARIRLSSIEATEIDDPLVDLLSGSGGALAPHLHVPLQSGSDTVLRLMRRWHTRDAYRRRVLEIAARLPRLGLGADVIVGFPGEGEAEFEETRSLIEQLPFTYLHVFPYSVRNGTEAALLPDRVPGDVAATRSRTLRELAHRKGRAYRERRAGEEADVVIEGDRSVTGGMTGDYLRVSVEGAHRPGQRLTLSLSMGEDGDLIAA